MIMKVTQLRPVRVFEDYASPAALADTVVEGYVTEQYDGHDMLAQALLRRPRRRWVSRRGYSVVKTIWDLRVRYGPEACFAVPLYSHLPLKPQVGVRDRWGFCWVGLGLNYVQLECFLRYYGIREQDIETRGTYDKKGVFDWTVQPRVPLPPPAPKGPARDPLPPSTTSTM